jgi:hypothetical protein
MTSEDGTLDEFRNVVSRLTSYVVQKPPKQKTAFISRWKLRNSRPVYYYLTQIPNVNFFIAVEYDLYIETSNNFLHILLDICHKGICRPKD